jgi:hypothetical protein
MGSLVLQELKEQAALNDNRVARDEAGGGFIPVANGRSSSSRNTADTGVSNPVGSRREWIRTRTYICFFRMPFGFFATTRTPMARVLGSTMAEM